MTIDNPVDSLELNNVSVSLGCAIFNSLRHASGMSDSAVQCVSLMKPTSQSEPCLHSLFPLSSEGVIPLDGTGQ